MAAQLRLKELEREKARAEQQEDLRRTQDATAQLHSLEHAKIEEKKRYLLHLQQENRRVTIYHKQTIRMAIYIYTNNIYICINAC